MILFPSVVIKTIQARRNILALVCVFFCFLTSNTFIGRPCFGLHQVVLITCLNPLLNSLHQRQTTLLNFHNKLEHLTIFSTFMSVFVPSVINASEWVQTSVGAVQWFLTSVVAFVQISSLVCGIWLLSTQSIKRGPQK